MIRIKFSSLILFALLLVCLPIPQPVTAQSPQPNQVNVLFILDDSGSMAGNDPNDLRYTAAKLFIASLDDQDQVAAIRFSSQSSLIISEFTPVGNSAQKAGLLEALQPVKADGYTDVKAALNDAEVLIQAAGGTGSKTVVIFLTDGKPEIPNPYTGYEDEALAVAKRLGAPVYAIALTHQSQSAFLNQVAAQTGGKVIPAKSANDLLDSYLQILGDLKDRTVMGEGAVHSPAETAIHLDLALMPYVSKVTFIVSQDPGVKAHLLGPDGTEIVPNQPQVSFAMTSDPNFSAYTVSNPASGDWTFRLQGSGSAQVRAILHSRLRTKIISPGGMIEAGQPMPITVSLIEEQEDGTAIKVVGDASFSALVTLPDGTRQSLDAFYDDGTHGDPLAGDGNFTREFVETGQPGTYRIAVQGFKGMIPVSAGAQVEAIPFPGIVIDQPAGQTYEIRSNAVSLQVRLAYLEDSADFEGNFLAQLTTPSGKTFNVPLTGKNGTYSGSFIPEETGTYQVLFQSKNAFYQGLPYQKGAQAEFKAVLYSQVNLQSLRLGLDGENNTEKFELQQAVIGIPLLVTIRSNSPQPQQVVSNLESLPGFTLAETGPIALAPNAETTATLHLIGDPQLTPGIWDGSMLLSSQGAVDISNNPAPVHFEVFIPQVSFSAEMVSQKSSDRCWQWAPVQLILKTESSSLQTETIQVQLDGMGDSSLSQQSIRVPPGHGQVELELVPSRSFTPGSYAGAVTFSGQRQGVEVTPILPLPVIFQVDPAWVSCRKPMIFSGVGFLAVIMIAAIVVSKRRNAAKPPIVTGTLTHWDKAAPDLTTQVDLTALNKNAITIGSGGQNDVIVPDESIDELHATIQAERVDDEVRVMLQPHGKVARGYREYTAPLPLEENTEYRMGNRVFQYIRDLDL